jgi:hypothetical protein
MPKAVRPLPARRDARSACRPGTTFTTLTPVGPHLDAHEPGRTGEDAAMNACLNATGKWFFVGLAVLVWIALIPFLDRLLSRSTPDSGPTDRSFEDVSARGRSLGRAA